MNGLVPSFSKWANYYSKYYSKKIFPTEEEGVTLGPSEYFDKFFTHGHINWLGKINRQAHYKSREIFNLSFYSFLLSKKYLIPSFYRMCVPSLRAGFMSAAKYDRPNYSLDHFAKQLSYSFMYKEFFPHMSQSCIRSDEDVLKDINLHSSCGTPHNLFYQNKTAFFSNPNSCIDDYYSMIGEKFPSEVVPIWTSTVKKELRHIKKLAAYKDVAILCGFKGSDFDDLRTFTAGPIELSFNGNKIYGDMNEKFYRSAGLTASCVGATKFSGGFNIFVNKLLQLPNGFALDAKFYDASLHSELLYDIRDFRYECFCSEDKTFATYNRNMNVYDSIVNSVIVLENGELVQKERGGPSGSSNTIVDNTLILFRLVAYSFILAALAAGIPADEITYEYFKRNVILLLNGDDNTGTVSDSIKKWYNIPIITKILAEIGVTITSDSQEFRSVMELDFLSHTFIKHKGIVLPCPESERVLCSLLYGSSIDDIRWHLMRAYALRIDSWPNIYCRRVLAEYISYVNQHYRTELVGEVIVSEDVVIGMSQISSMVKSDWELEALYTGLEGQCNIDSRAVLTLDQYKLFNYCLEI